MEKIIGGNSHFVFPITVVDATNLFRKHLLGLAKLKYYKANYCIVSTIQYHSIWNKIYIRNLLFMTDQVEMPYFAQIELVLYVITLYFP